jgi:hypothetical protein
MELEEYAVLEITESGRGTFLFDDGHVSEGIECRERQQAEDLAAVAILTGFREEKTGRRGIPPSVAAAGMPEQVTYMFAHPDNGVNSAEWFEGAYGIDRETVYAYVSRVRSEAEEKVKERSATPESD